jgi:hypothetical protein
MENQVTAENYKDFRHRFSFHDGIFENVQYDLLAEQPYGNLLVKIKIYERQQAEWQLVDFVFRFEHLTKLALRKRDRSDRERSAIDVIYKFHMTFANDLVYANFFPIISDETDLKSYDEIPNSNIEFVVVARKCFWLSTPSVEE